MMLLLHIEFWPYLSALETANALSPPELATPATGDKRKQMRLLLQTSIMLTV
jgi:hypothetical protein